MLTMQDVFPLCANTNSTNAREQIMKHDLYDICTYISVIECGSGISVNVIRR